MELTLDLSKEYGIVLEGGGAKGAYQIGAWKALREAGLLIRGVAGVSVGALNGALICMDDLEGAERVWENIAYSKVMNIRDDLMGGLRKRDLKAFDFHEVLRDFKRIVMDGGFDITPLRTLIGESVSEEAIRACNRELYITTYSLTDRKVLNQEVGEIPKGGICDMLLASASLPVFKNEKLGGKTYLDGGGFNNVPVKVLLDRGYENLIVIRIYGLGYDSERKMEIPEGVTIYHIAPRQNLGGILEFDKKRSRKNMVLGYYDAKRMLYGLCGRYYYIDAPESEAYYFDQLMSNRELLNVCMERNPGLEGKGEPMGCRRFTEELFPFLAKEFKLKPGWDYKDLYLGILEDLAKQVRISRFQIYRADRLLQRILREL